MIETHIHGSWTMEQHIRSLQHPWMDFASLAYTAPGVNDWQQNLLMGSSI
jgi:hypothetical protein